MKTLTLVNRNLFGAITDKAIITPARAILDVAIKNNILPAEYIEGDAKQGESLNYDVYDVVGATCVVQQRCTTWDKYGNHPKKEYFLLRKHGKGVKVWTVTNKSGVNRAAKADAGLGVTISKAQLGAQVLNPAAKKATSQGKEAMGELKASIKAQHPRLVFKSVSVCRSDAYAMRYCRQGVAEWCAGAGITADCITLTEMLKAYSVQPDKAAKLVILQAVHNHTRK